MERERARQLLEEHRQSVLRMVSTERQALESGGREDIFGDLSGADQHQADSGSETFERERDETIMRLAADVDEDIERALGKLAADRYGICETCGQAIPDERLEARPEARFCEHDERMWELSTIAMNVPGIPKALEDIREPGWRELDLLPGDDGLVADNGSSPEERALHVEEVGEWLRPEDVEDAEVDESAELAEEDQRRQQVEAQDRDELDEAARDEEALGR